jgi:putative transposase
VSGKGRAPFVSRGPLFPSAIARPGVREEAAFRHQESSAANATFVGLFLHARETRAPPGMRPHVPVQVVREYVYVYAAVAPAQGQMVSLILPETSTAMMNLELSHVSRSFPEHFIVMQVDQAGWHRSQELFIPANIRLIPQPAYSPEVNPVEHVWDELREKYFHNRIFPSFILWIKAKLDDFLLEVYCSGVYASNSAGYREKCFLTSSGH